MAVTFTDLHTEAGLKSLDQFVSGKPYISGDVLTKDDIKVYAAVVEKPGDSYPSASKWYESVSSQLASSFPGKAAGVRIGGKGAPEAAPAEEPKKDAPAGDDDDDDLDLFGDETEEDKKAAEEREAAKKASAKKKESGKSSMPGLLWGASKLVPVGYGIKKLQIMLAIVDDLVSVDTLIEDHLTAEPANEYIQSCDIVAFNKI
ncbi:Glutathione S-transferase [Parasponia andersonii]|uniref:Glutathione S-transferase n=1 Tax=Parasponia andersonii TaxID=3476 RepID=A0A2P5CDX3_PARAD|nr:Glutathione S-transferase [Parasponia andersonii]